MLWTSVGKMEKIATLPVQALTSPVKPMLEKKDCTDEVLVLNAQNVEWYKDNELIPGENRNPLTVSEPGSYYVVSRNHCGSSKSEVISVDNISQNEFVFENVITPNGDGKNDFFYIDNTIQNSALTIYDRWGMEVFQKHPYDNSWNAANLSDGVYYYSLRYPCMTNLVKGWIQVIKGID